MRLSLAIGVITLATGALVGCGTPNISHGPGGTGGNGNGSGGGGTGGGSGGSGGTGGGGGSGGGGADGGMNNCGVQNFMLVKGGTPDLLIIQDRSGSMSMDAMGGNTTPSKWTSITTAISQVVMSVTSVDWGLMMFPSTSGGGGIFGGCSPPTTPDVPVAAMNGAAVSSALSAASPNGGTPTTATLNAAVSYLQGLSNMHTHYLLLATDGEPNCGAGGGNSDAAAAEQAVTAAATAGIKTFVVGIGANTGADATLTQMAMNGGVPNMTPGQKAYYEVSSTTDLVTVLNKVAGQIVSCSYALQQAPANPNLVEIDGNGVPIPRDKTHMNGWDFGPGNLSINFYGAACDALQKGITTSVSAIYGCPPIG